MTISITRAARSLAVLATAAIALAGCGIGAGAEQEGGGVDQVVTRDFGQQRLDQRSLGSVRESDTVMRLLQGGNRVKTRYGGGFVQSIDGVAASGGRAWLYFVNGVVGGEAADDYELSGGDVVQWDYHSTKVRQDIPAIVGAFPEPFVRGLEGRKLPVRVECEDATGGPCERVKKILRDAGAPATGSALGTQGTQNVARVVVARWATARNLPTVRALEQGPRRSAVFARFSRSGELSLLDDSGRTVTNAGRDAGLVAALRPRDDQLAWVVTGGSQAGLERAVDAFRRTDLRDAFAVAAPARGAPVKLPVEAAR
ncbi:MAG TPA: DUF4430 domain-containing protein [Thermoleophilaceae bacterium]|nr:DUF4430 domain-containing protein [Thermoleophilaceae bacterium]